MKHSRGIELSPEEQTFLESDVQYWTLDALPEWYVLGGKCHKCGRVAWMDRTALAKRFSQRVYIGSISGRLRCEACGNRGGNRVVVGKLPR